MISFKDLRKDISAQSELCLALLGLLGLTIYSNPNSPNPNSPSPNHNF